jgi:hypothetical protein
MSVRAQVTHLQELSKDWLYTMKGRSEVSSRRHPNWTICAQTSWTTLSVEGPEAKIMPNNCERDLRNLRRPNWCYDSPRVWPTSTNNVARPLLADRSTFKHGCQFQYAVNRANTSFQHD